MHGSTRVLQKLLSAFGFCLAGSKIIKRELLPLGAWHRFSVRSTTSGRGSGEELQEGAGKVAGDALTTGSPGSPGATPIRVGVLASPCICLNTSLG